ncbi:calcium-binding protein, partial [Cognatishimia sp. F0-27]|uniref:calcium-binding protein n=1 Tax=Cognatishimia sp. F0-27 TaxID=2816855 RepID=UPI001D259EE6|nr:hypothetical protein [Cognatishimia sp. F0-27]
MPSFFISASSSTTRTLNDFETGIVGSGATLATTTNNGLVTMDGFFSELFVDGSLIGGGPAVQILDNPSVLISVGQNGSIMGGNSGVAGLIASSGNMMLANDGLISGRDSAFEVDVLNVPQVSINATNSGQMTAVLGTVFKMTVTDDSALLNSGAITGKNAVHWENQAGPRTVSTTNLGTIAATDTAFLSDSSDQIDLLRNSGTISGTVSLGDMGDSLWNSGAIDADVVDLGRGDDLYDGRFGSVTGLLEGGDGNDTILGGADGDRLDGQADHDVLEGGGGMDTLYGRDGDDRLEGGPGNDLLFGSVGDDRLKGDLGDDYLDGSFNTDTVIYSGVFASVFIDLENGVATGGGGTDQLVAIENAFGSAFA